MHIVIYRPHGKLQLDTVYYGPFNSFDEAYEFLCSLPALGYQITQEEQDRSGCKYLAKLVSPDDRP